MCSGSLRIVQSGVGQSSLWQSMMLVTPNHFWLNRNRDFLMCETNASLPCLVHDGLLAKQGQAIDIGSPVSHMLHMSTSFHRTSSDDPDLLGSMKVQDSSHYLHTYMSHILSSFSILVSATSATTCPSVLATIIPTSFEASQVQDTMFMSHDLV